MSSLSPWTILKPRLTRVSDGNPLRRLRLRLKGGLVGKFVFGLHGTPPVEATDYHAAWKLPLPSRKLLQLLALATSLLGFAATLFE